MMLSGIPKPIVLIILDGWGYAESTPDNAIAAAHTPQWDYLWAHCPHTLLQASGVALGLPAGQMGNSEVGHLTLGSGRTVYQALTRIDQAIEEGTFFSNEVLITQLQQAKAHQKAVHIMGLFSAGGVHSHERHFYALLQLAIQLKLKRVYIHVFLDGRDTPPQSAGDALAKLEAFCQVHPSIQVASLIGRYYAMDRDRRWDRTQKAYELLTQGQSDYCAGTVVEGLALAYARGESDEFVQATAISSASNPPVTLSTGDFVFFMNFRADRARQLSQALVDPNFKSFHRNYYPHLTSLVSLTQYADYFKTQVAFPAQTLTNTLGQVLASHGLKQLRIAETEKYAHVTFFFNGGVEAPLWGEERCLVPSPAVPTYNLQPEMSAVQMTHQLVTAIKAAQYDVIVCNFANPDMVGHTGDFKATVRAIETVDQCLTQIIQALRASGGEALITADHGNAECLYNAHTRQAHTAHTCVPVPFVYVGRPASVTQTMCATTLPSLSAVAPTILHLLGLTKPQEMTGENLIHFI